MIGRMNSSRCGIWCLLLLWFVFYYGCATGPDAVMAPGLASLLPDEDPILVMTPLAGVYQNEPFNFVDPVGVVNPRFSCRVAEFVEKTIREQLAKRGWKPLVSTAVDWQGLEAGKELADQKPVKTADPYSLSAAIVQTELDSIGRGLRVNEKIEGVREKEIRVDDQQTKALAGSAKSIVFSVVTGCDGRFITGPCGNIQAPLHRGHSASSPSFAMDIGLRNGLAIHLYWVDARSGKVLWYDDSTRFNLNPAYDPDLATLVERGLAEFPQKQE